MKVTVVGYSRFKALIGDQAPTVLELEKGTLRDAIDLLSRRYGKAFEDLLFHPLTREIKRSNVVLLNNHSYLNLRERLDSELKDGDEIAFMPAMVGG